MCKISLWLVEYILNQSIANFGRIYNSIEISLVGRAPGLDVLTRPLHWTALPESGTVTNSGFLASSPPTGELICSTSMLVAEAVEEFREWPDLGLSRSVAAIDWRQMG